MSPRIFAIIGVMGLIACPGCQKAKAPDDKDKVREYIRKEFLDDVAQLNELEWSGPFEPRSDFEITFMRNDGPGPKEMKVKAKEAVAYRLRFKPTKPAGRPDNRLADLTEPKKGGDALDIVVFLKKKGEALTHVSGWTWEKGASKDWQPAAQ